MKTIKSTATVYEIEKANGSFDIIIGANFDIYFVKTKDGIMEYNKNEMNEIYGLSMLTLKNIQEQLI